MPTINPGPATSSFANVTAQMGGGNVGSMSANSCEFQGASPNAPASVNLAAINSALSLGGFVTLTIPGTYYINGTLLIPSNTRLVLGAGVIIRRLQGTNATMLRNVNANSFPFSITTLTAVANNITGSNGIGYLGNAVCSGPHGLSVGNFVFIGGAVPNDYNGVWKVVAVPNATTFQYALSYFNGPAESVTLTSPATVNTGVAGVLSPITPGTLYTAGTYTNVPLTGGTGTGATATVVVNSSQNVSAVTITFGGQGYVIGDVLSAAAANIGGTGSGFSVPVLTINSPTGVNINTVTTISTSNVINIGYASSAGFSVGQTVFVSNFTGAQTITANNGTGQLTLSPGTASSSISNAVLTTNTYKYTTIVGALADSNIVIEGGTWYQDIFTDDGSAFQPTATTGLSGSSIYAVILNRVRNLQCYRMFFDNCYDGLVPLSIQDGVFEDIDSQNTGSTIQCMDGGRHLRFNRCRGETHDVTISFLQGNWYTWYGGPNLEFLWDFEDVIMRDTSCTNALEGIQITGQAGVKFRGGFTIDGLTGTVKQGSALFITYDDPQMGCGTYVDTLNFSRVITGNAFPNGAGAFFNGTALGSVTQTFNRLNISDCDIFCPTTAQNASSPYGFGFTNPHTQGIINVSNCRFWGTSASSNQAITFSSGVLGQTLKVSNTSFVNVANCVVGGFQSAGAMYMFDNIFMNGSAALLGSLQAAATGTHIFANNIGLINAIGNIFTSFNASSQGDIYMGNCSFGSGVAGGFINASIVSNANWRATWANPGHTPAAITGTAITPDFRFGMQTHTQTASTTVANPVGIGFSGSDYYTLTLVLLADASGTDTWTFGTNYVLQANTGQAAQVLTGTASKAMVLTFMYQGATGKVVQVNGPQTWN